MEFSGLLKNKVEFPRVTRENECGISRGVGFLGQEWSFVLSGIPGVKCRGYIKK